MTFIHTHAQQLVIIQWMDSCIPKKGKKEKKKQQPAGRQFAPLAHIIPIQKQPVFDFTPSCYVFSGEEEEANTSLIDFGLTRGSTTFEVNTITIMPSMWSSVITNTCRSIYTII